MENPKAVGINFDGKPVFTMKNCKLLIDWQTMKYIIGLSPRDQGECDSHR